MGLGYASYITFDINSPNSKQEQKQEWKIQNQKFETG